MIDDHTDTGTKTYEIQQLGGDGEVLASVKIDAVSGESAVKQLDGVVSGTESIAVCLDKKVMNEMDVDYWHKRLRGRR